MGGVDAIGIVVGAVSGEAVMTGGGGVLRWVLACGIPPKAGLSGAGGSCEIDAGRVVGGTTTKVRESCGDRSISFNSDFPVGADDIDDTDSSVIAEAAWDNRLRGLLSSRSNAVVAAAGGGNALVETAAAVPCVAVSGLLL